MTSDRVTDLSVKEKEKEKKLPHAKNTWKITKCTRVPVGKSMVFLL
jgi:hypothetical protein